MTWFTLFLALGKPFLLLPILAAVLIAGPAAAAIHAERHGTPPRSSAEASVAQAKSAQSRPTAAEPSRQAHAEGERVLRKEIDIRASVDAVWAALTTEAGLRFISRESRIELRPGGPYEWFLDLEPDENGRRGGEGSRILSLVPREMLSFTWTFPPSVPGLRRDGATTRVVLKLSETDSGGTLVRFTQDGWQEGDEWDQGYAYFDRAWSTVLERLRQTLETAGASPEKPPAAQPPRG